MDNISENYYGMVKLEMSDRYSYGVICLAI